jgi:hypothetical protein
MSSNWRALADEALGASEGENTRDTRNNSTPSVPSVPSVPALDPSRALKLWRAGLASVSAMPLCMALMLSAGGCFSKTRIGSC